MPVLVWVLDSADIELMQRWTADGSLPNIAALWKSSRVFPIGSDGWFDEIGTLVTSYSGIPATRHGYHCARRLKPRTYSMEFMGLEDAGARPCWQQMRDPEFRALIWDPIEACPLPGLPGTQIYNITAHQEAYAAVPAMSFPEEALESVLRKLGPRTPLAFNRFGRPVDYYRALLNDNLNVLARKAPIMRELVREGSYDLMVLGLNEIHDVGHVLWCFMDGKSPDRDPKGELADAVRSIYQRVDREIGAMLELLPPGTSVCLLSSYGMQDSYPTLGLTEDFMQKLGYQIPAAAKGGVSPLALARRMVPESIRHEISKHLPSTVQQQLLFSGFEAGTDFARSRAFVLPTSLYSNQIRINLKGREPAGIVEPGAEYAALVDEIEANLWKLIDPVTGEPAVLRVMRTAGHHIEGPSELLADIFIHWRPAKHFVDRLIHPRAELRQRPSGFHRESGHRVAGFAAISGPGIAPAQEGPVTLLDVAPTLLDLMGAQADTSMLGRSLLAN
jgi:predicted AlkP superfamily phosphohydrolase/phosphomutase